MKLSEIPFNMDSIYDESFIERPANIDEMKKGVDFILSKITDDEDEATRAAYHSLAGHFLRVLNKLDDSEGHLINAFDIYKLNKMAAPAFMAKYRLIHVYLYQRRFSKVDDEVKKCLEIIKKSSDSSIKSLKANILFLYGQSKMWQKEISEASRYFNLALENYVVKGEVTMINLCQKALVKCS